MAEGSNSATAEVLTTAPPAAVAPPSSSMGWELIKMNFDKCSQLKEEGNQHISRGDFTRASFCYKAAAMQISQHVSSRGEGGGNDQENAGMVKMLSSSSSHQKQEKPPAEVQKTLDSMYVSVKLNLAHASLKLNRPVRAVEAADEVLLLEPKNPKAHYRRGCGLLGKLDGDGAKAEFMQVLQLVPDDAAAAEKLKEAENLISASLVKEKKMFAKMFSAPPTATNE